MGHKDKAIMLQPINDSNLDQAYRLLAQGFPAREPSFWQTALDRLKVSGGNARAEVPLGYLMQSGKSAAGIVLTPATVQTTEDGCQRRVVNLSSWYVEDSERWRAPMMMRQLLRLENASFTDLTPTYSVQEMLKAFGFERINSGVSVSVLPLARLKGRRGARVVPLSDPLASQLDAATRDYMTPYQEFDCLVGVLIDGSEQVPLVFKRVRGRKIPLAMLVFSQNNEAVYRNLAAIGQYLARAGIHLLVLDIPPEGQIPGIAYKKRGNKFARGIKATNRTDFLGTELSLFDW